MNARRTSEARRTFAICQNNESGVICGSINLQRRILKLANKHAAEKAIRQSARRRIRNRSIRVSTRTEVKDANKQLATGNTAESEKAVKEAIQALDKAAGKGVIKKNNAARRKARLMKKLNQAKTAKA
jgi:small subunit ribosomal protein S20